MNHSIFDAKDNRPVSLDILLDDIKGKDIIYMGEFHQIPEVLSFQTDLISGLILKGVRPSIGLEMFNVLQQKLLDYYIARLIPFEQLLSLYEAGPEGFDLNHYMPLIDIAVTNRLKVIGLNIPRSVASAVAKYGLDSHELKGFLLNEEEIKNCSKEYREAINSVYKKHPHREITEENFILAQSVKDEMMAETIIHHLTDEPSEMPLVVIAGRGHVEYRLGIPERVRQKLRLKDRQISDILIISSGGESYKQGIADYILLTET